MNKPFRPCVIHVGDNRALSAAVQRELFRLGWKWSDQTSDPIYLEWAHLFAWSNGNLAYSNRDSRNSIRDDWPRFDAATQFGALMEYLNKPEEVKVEMEIRDCQKVEVFSRRSIYRAGDVRLTFPDPTKDLFLFSTEIDDLYAASQAARREAK